MSGNSEDNNGRKPPSVGAELFFCRDLKDALLDCRSALLDFAVLPLVHPRAKRLPKSTNQRAHKFGWPLTRSDTLLDSHQWSSAVVGRLSPWLRLDGNCESEVKASEAALREEIAWATHLSLSAVLAPFPAAGAKGFYNYARNVNHILVKAQSGLNIWLEVPDSEWSTWNRFRCLCDFSASLHIALKLDIPSIEATEENLTQERWLRWTGEPVRALLLPMADFVLNASGYPTLPPKTRKLVIRFYERGAQFLLTGKARHANGILPYQMYLVHLCKKSASRPSYRDQFEAPFYDYLQIPLQPLGDNLESQTYETFEKDPVKYARYEEAVKLALIRAASIVPASEELIVMVVGAGRGPLIKASLRGARSANLESRVRIYGVEKNPNAVITLLNMFPRNGPDRVEIISIDMREWNAPSKADVIVSELLGSWGDNELSPECLRGVVPKYLKPHGVSVPSSYDSFLAPIMSQRVWSDVRGLSKGPTDIDPCTAANGVQRFETPYVVRLFNFYHVDSPKVCFHFEERLQTPQDIAKEEDGKDVLERYAVLDFHAKEDAVVHGFVGYFTAVLFEQVDISIHPETFSDGMFSWFPLFLPIREPLNVKQGERIRTYVWRRRSKSKVWYEWAVETESGQMTPIHNPTGRSYAVNM